MPPQTPRLTLPPLASAGDAPALHLFKRGDISWNLVTTIQNQMWVRIRQAARSPRCPRGSAFARWIPAALPSPFCSPPLDARGSAGQSPRSKFASFSTGSQTLDRRNGSLDFLPMPQQTEHDQSFPCAKNFDRFFRKIFRVWDHQRGVEFVMGAAWACPSAKRRAVE